MSGVLCAGTTSRGRRCLNRAKDGAFCPGHDVRNQCQAPTKSGRCQRRSELGGGYCIYHKA